MPQVIGLCENKLKWEPQDYRYLKLTEEIKELENSPYELFYNIYNKWYGIYFEFNESKYCILIEEGVLYLGYRSGKLFSFKDGELRSIDNYSLGEEINNLCHKFTKIITKKSTDRIKFLLKK